MPTLRVVAIIPAAMMMLGACGGDSPSSPTTIVPTSTAVSGAVAADTTLAAPQSTTVDSAVADDSSAETPLSGPVQIDVRVGQDSGADRIEHVTVGSDITLNITNPNAADEFHVHGIELEQSVDAGVMATFNFTIDTAGSYEVESHVTQDVLIIIEAV